jgi:glucokinase
VGGTLAMPRVLNANHRTNRLLAVLASEDFASLEPHLERVELTRKQVLYDTGKVCIGSKCNGERTK